MWNCEESGNLAVSSCSQKELIKDIVWELDRFFNRSSVRSPVFFFAGSEWRMELRHETSGPVLADMTVLYVGRKGPLMDSSVRFTMGIKRDSNEWVLSSGEFMRETGCSDQRETTIPEFQLQHAIRTLLPGNSLGIFCRLRMWERFPRTPPNHGVDKALDDFGKLLYTGEDSDMVFRVEGEELKAHSIILSSRVPVFNAMLCHDTAEKRSCVVNIEDCEADVFREFLHYVYTGRPRDLTAENACALYAVGDKYQLQELKEECIDCLKHTLSVEGFCCVVTLALLHDEAELLDAATNFFSEWVREVIRTEDWEKFLTENPTEANDLLIKALGPPRKRAKRGDDM